MRWRSPVWAVQQAWCWSGRRRPWCGNTRCRRTRWTEPRAQRRQRSPRHWEREAARADRWSGPEATWRSWNRSAASRTSPVVAYPWTGAPIEPPSRRMRRPPTRASFREGSKCYRWALPARPGWRLLESRRSRPRADAPSASHHPETGARR